MNAFQKNVVLKLGTLGERLNLKWTSEVLEDDTILIAIGHLKIFVYQNEVQIVGNKIDERYESYDFEINKNLLDVFFSELESFLIDRHKKSLGIFEQLKKLVGDMLSRYLR